jgi:hypothetical protein
MRRGRLAHALAIVTVAGLAVRVTAAPGDGSGSGSGSAGEIEMEPAGSGSAGSAQGSAAAPTPPAGDQTPVKDPKAAKKWLGAAQTLVQKGDVFARQNKPVDAKSQYENAVTAFEKAIETGDDPAVYLQLAAAEEKLGTLAAAYRHLKVLVDPKTGAKPDVTKKAQSKLDELSTKVGLVTLTVTPDGTSISLGGKQIGEAPMTEPLVFDAGAYTLTLAAVGYQPKEVELKVEPGSESERKIALEPMKVVAKPIGEEEPDHPIEGPKEPSILPIYVGAGATVGLVLIATVTGISAVSQHSTYTDPQTASVDRKDAQSSGRTLAHVTDICLVGALAAGAFTTYWYAYKWAPQMKALGKDHWLLIGPWASNGAGGAVVSGSF